PPPKLFVGGVKRETTKLDLQKYFEQYDTVKDCFIVPFKLTRESRRFGFVEFEDPSSAQKALQVHDHVILGKKAKKKKPNDETVEHNKSWESQQSRKIFVGDIPQTVTQQELKSFFEKFGRVTDDVLVQDRPAGTHRGFGFITFESKNSPDAALNNKYHELNGSQVEVKRANPMVRNDHVRHYEFFTGQIFLATLGIFQVIMTGTIITICSPQFCRIGGITTIHIIISSLVQMTMISI
ncbi:DAZ-associated protein 1, partial [Linum perenne]